MSLFRWIVGGLIGGLVGITVWVLIGYFTRFEVGWIAWGVGFVVGVGVRYAAHRGDQEESFGQGIVAAAIAIGSILTAKFLIFSLVTGGSDLSGLRELANSMDIDDESMIASQADQIAEQMMEQKQPINWPPGMTFESASKKADYPPNLWQAAEARWQQLSEQEKQKHRQQRAQLISTLAEAGSISFGDFFSPWDILWFILAAATAFRVGVGSYGNDD